MSETGVTAASSAAEGRWRSIPEIVAVDTSGVWWFLLLLAALPVFLLIRTDGDQRAAGLLLMYAGTIGVFIAIRRQYLRILKWRNAFSSFLRQSSEAATCITDFAHRCWHLSAGAIGFALAFTCAAAALFYKGGLFDYDSAVARAVSVSFVVIASYVCATGLAAMFQMARLVRLLAQFGPFVTPHQFGVLSAGHILVSAFADAGIVWCLYTSTAAACREAWLIPAAGLAFPAMLYFGSAFLGAQLPLHREMLEYKCRVVRELEDSIRAIEVRVREGITEDEARHLEFYERRLETALELPEWPFRWPALFAVISSGAATVLAPLATSALSELVSRIQI